MTSESERGPVSRSALARLISAPTDEFAAQYWGTKPLLSTSDELPADLGDLFGADAVDELISSRGLRTPFIRMAKEGSVLPPVRFTDSGGYGAEVGDQVDSAKVLAEFAAGSTIVLQGLHRTWAPLNAFTRRLVHDVGHPAQVNAYITPASSRGFDPHYDVHDVFVIQIAGRKHWTIHEPVHPDPLRGQPWTDHRDAVSRRATETPAIDATFTPGDVLYLPRGWIHSAVALGGTSIHLTIGVAALTRYDVVEQLITELADDPALRSSLPLGMDLDAVRDTVRGTLTDAATRLSADDAVIGTVASRLTGRVRDTSRPEGVRPLATTDAIQTLSADATVAWRDGLDARIDDGDDTVRIVRRSSTVTLPAEASAAVHALRAGDPIVVAELPGLDVDSAVVVAKRLLREAVLVVR